MKHCCLNWTSLGRAEEKQRGLNEWDMSVCLCVGIYSVVLKSFFYLKQ